MAEVDTVASAQGEDRSGYQKILNWPLPFGFAKASEKLTFIDPTFAHNWANLKSQKRHRGAYHYFHPSYSPIAQAEHFVAVVKAQGLLPGDMLAIDAEITAGIKMGGATEVVYAARGGARSHVPFVPSGEVEFTVSLVNSGVRVFCDEVRKLVGPHNPIFVYSDLSIAQTLTEATGYPLWIAYPASAPPHSVAPWKSWTIWQWEFGGGPGGGDRDAFNGTVAALDKYIASYLPKPAPTPPPKPPTPKPTPKPAPIPTVQEQIMGQLNSGAGAQTVISVVPGSANFIEFGNDCTLTKGDAPVLRLAIHSATKGWSQVNGSLALPPSASAKVTFLAGDADIVSVQRLAGPDTVVSYTVS